MIRKIRHEAVKQSGIQHLRAIILTSVATAVGLSPVLVETSTQAPLPIPIAISASSGILCATVITLFLVPCLYVLQVGFPPHDAPAVGLSPGPYRSTERF
ncbi:MAG: efflux RND transporter permease subunit [Woeseiaceae bacterium]|nr:efflux RND transporter permease subunit [Woeseiaceae bacterium]